MDALAAFSSHRVSRSGATGLLSTLLSPVYSTVSCLLYCLLSTLFPLRRYRSAVSHRILHCTLSAHASPPPPQSLREYFEGRDAAGSGTDAWEERCAALAATREAALLSAAAAIEARLQGIMGKLEVEFRRRRLRISLSGAEMSAGAPIRVAVRTTVEKRPSTTGGFALALLRRATPASALAMLRGHGRPANPSLLEVASTTTVATMVRATAHSPPRREPHRRTASLPSPSSRSSRLLKQLMATTTVSSLYLPSRFTESCSQFYSLPLTSLTFRLRRRRRRCNLRSLVDRSRIPIHSRQPTRRASSVRSSRAPIWAQNSPRRKLCSLRCGRSSTATCGASPLSS